MQITGLLHRVLPQVTNKTYTTRKIWIKTEAESQYPQIIELETPNNKTELFGNIPIGARITCDVNLRGRTWTNKQGEEVCFTTLQVWKVTRDGAGQPYKKEPVIGDVEPQGSGYVANQQVPGQATEDDGLPFRRPHFIPSLP